MDALRLASAAATASHRAAPASGVDAHGGGQRAAVQLGETPAPVPAQTRLLENADAGWCYRTALAAQPQAADAALATALGSAADLDWDALPAHIDRLLACMAQPPSAAHQPLAVPLDPSQLIPLLDHPLLQRWLAALACQQRHSTGVAREKPKASTPEPSVAALFDAFDPQQVELYIYSDACSNHPRAINATHWHDSRHASTNDLAGLIRGERIDLLLDAHAMAQLKAQRAAARTDTDHGARDLEHLLTRMVARNDAGLPPIPLAAEPAPRRD